MKRLLEQSTFAAFSFFEENRFLIALPLLFFISHFTWAQDTHHWGNQFGTRAALLGGAVLTDTLDNAGVFYNPGNLAYLDSGSLSLNANFYGLESIQVENALGDRADFKGLQFNSFPLLISGSFSLKNKLRIHYGLLTPVNFKFNGIARIDRISDLVDEAESPGPEELLAESGVNTRVQETTLALGIGKKINPNFSYGVSLLSTLRSVDYSFRFAAKTLTNSDDYILISRTENQFVNYSTVRSALKGGFNYQGNGFAIGMTVTSPSLNLFGNGTVAEDLTLTNLKPENSDQRVSAYASDRQEKLKAKFKSPLEIGLGLKKQWGSQGLSLNIGHYFGFDSYRLIEAEPNLLIRPELTDQFTSADFLNVETAMKPVTNFAIAYENRVKENLELMGSFRTDFSYFDEVPSLGNQLTTEFTQWNIFHLTFGGVHHKEHSSLTLGLAYSFGGTDAYVQEASFTDSDPNPPIEGVLSIVKAKYSNIGAIIGYSFYFKKLN